MEFLHEFYVGDARNTPFADAGTPLGATTVVTLKECWLFTLGVLRPGIPVMWQTHIRDLYPTAGSCKGGRLSRGNKKPWLIVSTGDGL